MASKRLKLLMGALAAFLIGLGLYLAALLMKAITSFWLLLLLLWVLAIAQSHGAR